MVDILDKLKNAYIVWHNIHIILPQINRYTLGNRIDKLFIVIIENSATAFFSPKEEKVPYISLAIRKMETLKILLLVLWETKSIDNEKYISITTPLDEVGKILGGWHNQTTKQNPMR